MSSKSKKTGQYVMVYFGNEHFPCIGFVPYSLWDEEKKLELGTNAELCLAGEACRQFLKETDCLPKDVHQKMVTIGEDQLKELERIINENIYQFQ